MTEQTQQNPTTFGKYQLLKELGQGGFGTVYLAHDRYLDIQRAIKLIHPVLMTDGTFMESFRKEARFAAKLDHPNLVPVYDFGQEDGRFYLVMKYMQGGSLKEKIVKQGPMSPKQASKIFLQVCDGVRFAHSQGVIHRDLKPSNILFDQDDSVRVGDLGFAKAINASKSSTMSKSGSFLGTPEYMAPEIWEGKDASKQSDIYSLGCILYEMLTGKILFEGSSPAAIMTKHVIHGPDFDSRLTPSLQTIMKKALASNPKDRYVNVKELEEALKNYIFLQPLLGESQSTSSIEKPTSIFSEDGKKDGQPGTFEGWIETDDLAYEAEKQKEPSDTSDFHTRPIQISLIKTIKSKLITNQDRSGFRSELETEHQEPAIANEDEKVEQVNENERQTATLGVVEVLLDEILGDIQLPGEPSSKDVSTWIDQLENQHAQVEENIPEGTNEGRPVSKKINPAIIKVLFILGLSLLGLFLGYVAVNVNNQGTASVATANQPDSALSGGSLSEVSDSTLTSLQDNVVASVETDVPTMQPTLTPIMTPNPVPTIEQAEEPISWHGTSTKITRSNIDQLSRLDIFAGMDQVLFSDDGTKVATLSYSDGKIFVRKALSSEVILEVSAKDKYDEGILADFSSDGKYMAVYYWRWIKVWDTDTGELVCEYYEEKGGIDTIQFRPNSTLLVYIHYSGWIRFLDVLRELKPFEISDQTGNIVGFGISPDGNRLVTLHSEGNYDYLKVWNLPNQVYLRYIALPPNVVERDIYDYSSVILFLDDTTFLVGNDDSLLYKVNSTTGDAEVIADLQPHFPQRLALSPDNSLLVVSTEEYCMIFETEKFSKIMEIIGGHNKISISPQGDLLILNSDTWNNDLKVWGIP